MEKSLDTNPDTVALTGDRKIDPIDKTVLPASSIHDGIVETQTQAVSEPEKTYYSKLSVWLMVLFSGLAIGSDG